MQEDVSAFVRADRNSLDLRLLALSAFKTGDCPDYPRQPSVPSHELHSDALRRTSLEDPTGCHGRTRSPGHIQVMIGVPRASNLLDWKGCAQVERVVF